MVFMFNLEESHNRGILGDVGNHGRFLSKAREIEKSSSSYRGLYIYIPSDLKSDCTGRGLGKSIMK